MHADQIKAFILIKSHILRREFDISISTVVSVGVVNSNRCRAGAINTTSRINLNIIHNVDGNVAQ